MVDSTSWLVSTDSRNTAFDKLLGDDWQFFYRNRWDLLQRELVTTHCEILGEMGYGPRCEKGTMAWRAGDALCWFSGPRAADLIEAILDPSSTVKMITERGVQFDELDDPHIHLLRRRLREQLEYQVFRLASIHCLDECAKVVDPTAEVEDFRVLKLASGEAGLWFKFDVTWKCATLPWFRKPVFAPRQGRWWGSGQGVFVNHKKPTACPDTGFVEVCVEVRSTTKNQVKITNAEIRDAEEAFADHFRNTGAAHWECPHGCAQIEWGDPEVRIEGTGKSIGSVDVWQRYCIRQECRCVSLRRPPSTFPWVNLDSIAAPPSTSASGWMSSRVRWREALRGVGESQDAAFVSLMTRSPVGRAAHVRVSNLDLSAPGIRTFPRTAETSVAAVPHRSQLAEFGTLLEAQDGPSDAPIAGRSSRQ